MSGTTVVLGGTGFLGRHAGAALAAAGHTVCPVSRTGAIAADLAGMSEPELRELFVRLEPGLVVNAAGTVWQPSAPDDLDDRFVTRLVRAVAGLRRRPRLIQFGTVHEYGAGSPSAAVDESWPAAPVTAYGRAKLAATRVVLDATRQDGLDAVVLRIANVCGPGTPDGSLLGRVTERLVSASAGLEPVRLELGPLDVRRDYLDVRDVADAVRAVARVPAGRLPSVLNIGRGETVVVANLVDELIAISGVAVERVNAPITGRADVTHLRIDTGRAATALGWQPRRSLSRSLRDQLRHARSALRP